MIRISLLAGATALCLAPLASAQNNCERIKDEKALLGGVVGAVAGGVIGAAIADGDDHGRYRNRGYRGYRGYGHRRHHHRGGDGDQVAGAVIGGVLGAVVGSSIGSSSTKCANTETYQYGDVASPTRLPYGPAWNTNPDGSLKTQEVSQDYGYGQRPLYGGPNSATGSTQTQVYEQPYTPECQTAQRETRLPDGSVIREPVEICRQEDGSWQFSSQAYGY